MHLPTFPRSMAAVRHVQTAFGGYDHRPACPEGGIYEMINGSAADSPLFATRPGRTLSYPSTGQPNGLFAAGDGLLWCAGTALYHNGEAVPGCTLTDTAKVFAELGGTVLIIVISLSIRRMPYTIRSSTAIIGQISPSVEEASISLGASQLKTFLRVTIPMMLPGVLSGAIMSWITLISELSSSVILYTSKTMTLTVAIYSEVIRSNFGNAAAYSTILTLTSIVSLLVFFKLSGKKDLSV